MVEDILISDDRNIIDLDLVYNFLSQESYWAKDLPRDIFETSLDNSYCLSLFSQKKQIGFARLITDYATYAYLADVFISREYRGRGYSKLLLEHINKLGWYKKLRRVMLVTKDAHQIYLNNGFSPLANPDRILELHRPEIYNLSHET